ncbi:sugar-binding protein, partial [Rhodococcus sp. 06-1477-1B]
MKKRFIAAAALTTVAAIALAGCSDPGAGGGSAAGPADWPAQDTDLSGTTLTIWAAQNSNKIPDSVVTGFEAATGATVDV